jgi:hypothetical protein
MLLRLGLELGRLHPAALAAEDHAGQTAHSKDSDR